MYHVGQTKRLTDCLRTGVVSAVTATGIGLSRPTTPLTRFGENSPFPDSYRMGEKAVTTGRSG